MEVNVLSLIKKSTTPKQNVLLVTKKGIKRGRATTHPALYCPRALLLKSPGSGIQGVDGFVPCVLILGGRRNKLHLFRVMALIGRPLTLIHTVEVGLEVAILLKLLGQGQQDFA